MLTLAAWKGGKACTSARLIPLFPPHRCYVEPFGGMASLLLNKPESEVEVYNDRDERLVGLFNCIKYHPDELDKELAWHLKSRRTFERFREQPGVTDIQAAGRFLFVQCLGWGGAGAVFGPSIKKSGGALRSVDMIRSRVAQTRKRFSSVIIEWLDWEQCIEKYDSPETFFFCDPPYMQTSGYRIQFVDRDQEALATRLKRIKGKFLMTNSDLPAVRQLYRGFPMTVLRGRLSVERSHARALMHLVVANYPLRAKR